MGAPILLGHNADAFSLPLIIPACKVAIADTAPGFSIPDALVDA